MFTHMVLVILFALFAAALTGVTYYFSGLYLGWWWFWTVPVFFYAYFWGCFGTWIIFLYVGSLFVSSDDDYIYKPNPFAQWCVRHTCRVMALLFGAKVHVSGMGKLPKRSQPVVLVHNHLSTFDEMILAAYFPRQLVFISKPSNFHMPVAGAWMRYAGYLPIKQGDMADGAKIIALAAETISKKGVSVCVAPEGTRNKEFPNPVMLPFHPGTFRLAKDSGAPLVVAALQNTNFIFKRFPKGGRTHVYLDIVGVLSPEECAEMTPKQIADRSFELISKRFEHKDARFYHMSQKKKKEEGEGD